MNKLPRPQIQDGVVIQNLADNSKLKSHPYLQNHVTVLQQLYLQYETAQGNALVIGDINIDDVVGEYLKGHFKQPPNELNFINQMRKNSEYLSCPMCGSLSAGTLDHFFPQVNYGAFSVLSLNLIPACKCNSKRQDRLVGSGQNERILHPYFDDCLSERIISAHFQDLNRVPKVSLRLCVDENHPEYAAIRFHVNTIVENSAVIDYLGRRWSQLCRKPSVVVRFLKNNPPTVAALQEILEEDLALLDEEHNGKNNWPSVFVAGLLDPLVLDWLSSRFQVIGRLPDDPLFLYDE